MTEPLSNAEANRLAAKIEQLGGRMIDHMSCRACKNYTMAVLPYTTPRSRQSILLSLCLWCDEGRKWPRLEEHEEPNTA